MTASAFHARALRDLMEQPITCVWVKMKPPGNGQQVLVIVSICRGNPFWGYPFFDHHSHLFSRPSALGKVRQACVPKETRKAIQLFKRGAGMPDEAFEGWVSGCVPKRCESTASPSRVGLGLSLIVLCPLFRYDMLCFYKTQRFYTNAGFRRFNAPCVCDLGRARLA